MIRLKVITNLKNYKSTGTDNIDTYVIKLVAQEIVAPLTHSINISIAKCTFPSIWNHAKVLPLLRKGDPLIAKNYRPVAVLPIFSKILERVVFNQLVSYLDSNNLIHPNHHGSRSGQLSYRCMIPGLRRWTRATWWGS